MFYYPVKLNLKCCWCILVLEPFIKAIKYKLTPCANSNWNINYLGQFCVFVFKYKYPPPPLINNLNNF